MMTINMRDMIIFPAFIKSPGITQSTAPLKSRHYPDPEVRTNMTLFKYWVIVPLHTFLS